MKDTNTEKGQKLTLQITTLDSDGSGVALTPDKRSLHIAGGTPGDRLEVLVEHVSPHTTDAWGRVLRILERGPDFTMPVCPHASPVRGRCGGCPLMHLRYPAQLANKAQALQQLHTEVASDDPPSSASAEAIDPAPALVGYRNRANFVVGRYERRIRERHRHAPGAPMVRLGSYEQRSHRISRMDGCRIIAPALREVAIHLEDCLSRHRALPVGLDESGLRYVGMRANRDGEVLVELIVTEVPADGSVPDWLGDITEACQTLEGVRGVAYSVNDSKGNALRQGQPAALWGKQTLLERLGPITLELGVDTFFQLNTEVAEQMYGMAAAWAAELLPAVSSPPDAVDSAAPHTLWDLYCGVGGLGLSACHGVGNVRLFGAEVTGGAVDLALRNAAQNKVAAEFHTSDLQTAPASFPTPDLVLVNPPRRGLDPQVLSQLGELGTMEGRPPIIYMSCNPETLARDAEALGKSGYRLRRTHAFDMLPQTTHVEVLALLQCSSSAPPST